MTEDEELRVLQMEIDSYFDPNCSKYARFYRRHREERLAESKRWYRNKGGAEYMRRWRARNGRQKKETKEEQTDGHR